MKKENTLHTSQNSCTKGTEEAGMNATIQTVSSVQQARRRAMVLPREHGAWGLLLVPLFTGVVAGFAPEHRIWSLLLFTLASLSLFFLRTPVESLLGMGTISASSRDERRTAMTAAASFGFLAGACLFGLMWKGRYSLLLALAAVCACAFVVQALLRKLGRGTRMISQLVGAIGLTCTAPGAYYIGTGRLDWFAVVLWIANWIFAGNQIHFVQLRIHAARAATFTEKFQRGRWFLLAQPVLLTVLVFASLWHIVPPLAIIAFIPAVVRGSRWFFKGPEPFNVKSLGWSEMKHGVVFGLLLAMTFVYR